MGWPGQTHCKDGHELTPANTYLRRHRDGRVQRRCRICHIAGSKIWDVFKRKSPKKKKRRPS